MTDRPRIVLGEDDFADVPAAAPPVADAPRPKAPKPEADQGLHGPGELPPVARGARVPVTGGAATRPLRTAPMGGSWWLNDPLTAQLLAAAAGVVLAWVLTEVLGVADITATSKSGSNAASGLWTGVVGAVLGCTLLTYDRAVAGAWEEVGRRALVAALPMLAIGFVSGYIANALYLEIVESVFEDMFDGSGELSLNDVRFYLARGLGWAIFGAGIGAAIGVVDQSRARAVNGAIGGALGGAAGGLAFQFVAANLGASDAVSRLLGLLAIGALIAVATRAVETARREAWLQVVAGGMAGKEFILYHDVTRIGASPDAEIFLLKDAGVAKRHAEITQAGAQRVLSAVAGQVVLVNGQPVVRHALRSGDRIEIGSTAIAYSERAAPMAGVASA
jgi:hypothetical protein